ncbi:MAG TPA: BamA/TamA family outer membrane protein [Bryobacteraceae bacterium]|nr:BamA/TamA family outer membrane protein [Bryobacteraceae bacterium]
MPALALLLTLPFGSSIICGSLFADEELYRAAAETNVNRRYTIESIAVAGVQIDRAKLPSRLRQRMNALVGKHCDVAVLQELAADLRSELHLREVNQHLLRGSRPDRVRVDFDVVRKPIDISVPRFLYHSQQGFSGEVAAQSRIGENSFSIVAVSNGDDLTERFTGIAARYDDSRLGTDRVRFGIGFEDYHEQWNSATRAAIEPDTQPFDLYRSRRNIAPELTFVLMKPVTVSVGTSFERTESENPATGARSANAITAELHYGRKIEGDTVQQTVDGRYGLRVGSHGLGSDYSYSRHMISLRYEIKSGRQTASDEFIGGAMAGAAPMFERFVLGSSDTLRGWDRYAIDPLGGDRMVHNSLTYGYRLGERTAEVFYDSGALWNEGGSARFRHSVGVGYRQGVFVLTMAFPVTQGRIEPVFMAGMNY